MGSLYRFSLREELAFRVGVLIVFGNEKKQIVGKKRMAQIEIVQFADIVWIYDSDLICVLFVQCAPESVVFFCVDIDNVIGTFIRDFICRILKIQNINVVITGKHFYQMAAQQP